MADTKDRRVEGKGTTPYRERYKRLECAGLCVSCGKTPTKNRKYCYECSDKQAVHNGTCHFRKILKDCGVKDYDRLKRVVNDAIEAYERSLGVKGMFENLDDLDTMYSLRYAVLTAAPKTKQKGKSNGKV